MNYIKQLLGVAALATMAMSSVGKADDATFFALYDQVNSADIEIAELGVIKGNSVELRRVAAMILRDHAGVRQMARDIAADNGITYDLPADKDMAATHAENVARLSQLEGAAFDEAYLQLEVPFHRGASEAVRNTFIPSVENDEFREHLEAVLPHFEHHLSATIEAAQALGYQVTE